MTMVEKIIKWRSAKITHSRYMWGGRVIPVEYHFFNYQNWCIPKNGTEAGFPFFPVACGGAATTMKSTGYGIQYNEWMRKMQWEKWRRIWLKSFTVIWKRVFLWCCCNFPQRAKFCWILFSIYIYLLFALLSVVLFGIDSINGGFILSVCDFRNGFPQSVERIRKDENGVKRNMDEIKSWGSSAFPGRIDNAQAMTRRQICDEDFHIFIQTRY